MDTNMFHTVDLFLNLQVTIICFQVINSIKNNHLFINVIWLK